MLRGTILGCAETLNTRVTKIGLIDPDDPTKEEDGSHVDKGNTSSMAGVLDPSTPLIRRPSLLIDGDDGCEVTASVEHR